MNIGKLGAVGLVSVLVEVSIGGLDGVEAYANKVKPGVGGMLPAMLPGQLASVVGASSLDGARPDQAGARVHIRS